MNSEGRTIRLAERARAVGAGLAACVLLTTLGACAASVSMSQRNRGKIQSVTVSDDVPVPDQLYYQGRKESILMGSLGVAGAAAAGGTGKKTGDVIADVMNKAGIDVGEIAADRFRTQLNSAGVFGNVVSDCDGCPSIHLSVRFYGFAQPHGLSSQLRATIGVEGTMIDSTGRVLWKKYSYVTALNKQTPSHTLKEYLEKPELLREGFTVATDTVVSDLIDDLRGR